MNDIKEIVDRDGNAVDRIPVSTGDAPSLDSVDPLVLPSGVLQFTSDLAGEMHRCAQGMAIPAELVTTASKATTAREIMLLDAMRQNAAVHQPLAAASARL